MKSGREKLASPMKLLASIWEGLAKETGFDGSNVVILEPVR